MWRREQAFLRAFRDGAADPLGRLLEGKIPPALDRTLHGAFARAFRLVFEKGEGVVRWAARQQRREEACRIRDFTARLRQDRSSLRAFSRSASAAGWGSVLQAGVQGVGLGLLGIGLPDIPLFTLTLLKSVRETAVSFGFFEDGPVERAFALEVIAAALSAGGELDRRNRSLNRFIQTGAWENEDAELSRRIGETAEILSRSMLHWKFVQGFPLAGAAAGAWDAVCLRRVQRYAAIKYQRRFLIGRALARDNRG